MPEWSELLVLLVEDNKINQKVACRMLASLGVKSVDVADDGFQGIEAISKKKYDLILMDLSMPGMSGLEATEHVRANRPVLYESPPLIVAMTANALSSDRQKCFDVGMDDFVSKPFSKADLMRILNLSIQSNE
jgi:CheY-like chemotaxis protein